MAKRDLTQTRLVNQLGLKWQPEHWITRKDPGWEVGWVTNYHLSEALCHFNSHGRGLLNQNRENSPSNLSCVTFSAKEKNNGYGSNYLRPFDNWTSWFSLTGMDPLGSRTRSGLVITNVKLGLDPETKHYLINIRTREELSRWANSVGNQVKYEFRSTCLGKNLMFCTLDRMLTWASLTKNVRSGPAEGTSFDSKLSSWRLLRFGC